jgi:hypothetical protein
MIPTIPGDHSEMVRGGFIGTVILKLMKPSEQTRVSMRAKKHAAPGFDAEKYPMLKNTLFRKPIS